MTADNFIVPLLRSLAVQSHVAVIDGREYGLGGVHYNLIEFGIFSHSLDNLMNREAIYFACGHRNNGDASLLPGERESGIRQELTLKFHTDNMLCAIGGI